MHLDNGQRYESKLLLEQPMLICVCTRSFGNKAGQANKQFGRLFNAALNAVSLSR